MERRKFFFLVVTALMAFAAFFAGSQEGRAQKQNPDCCHYTVDISGFPDYCFPFKLVTYWGDGSVGVTAYEKNGVYVEQIPSKCPPAPAFKCATLDPNGPCVGIGESAKYQIGKCCYVLTVKVDDKGCIYIIITPC